MAKRSRCGWAANGDGASATAVFPTTRCESTESGSIVPLLLSGTFVCIKVFMKHLLKDLSLAALEAFMTSFHPI